MSPVSTYTHMQHICTHTPNHTHTHLCMHAYHTPLSPSVWTSHTLSLAHTHRFILILGPLGIRTEAKTFPHPAHVSSPGKLTGKRGKERWGGEAEREWEKARALSKFWLTLREAEDVYSTLKRIFAPPASAPGVLGNSLNNPGALSLINIIQSTGPLNTQKA